MRTTHNTLSHTHGSWACELWWKVTIEKNILKLCSTSNFWEDNQMTWISVDKETSRISGVHLQPLRGLMSNIHMGCNPNHVWKLSNCTNYKLYSISPVFGRWLYTEIPVGVFCREDQIKCDRNNDCFQIYSWCLEKLPNYCINVWAKTNILATTLQYFGWGGKGGSDKFSLKSYQKNNIRTNIQASAYSSALSRYRNTLK